MAIYLDWDACRLIDGVNFNALDPLIVDQSFHHQKRKKKFNFNNMNQLITLALKSNNVLFVVDYKFCVAKERLS